MNLHKHSTFVNVLAWIFIVLAGFTTLISILQNVLIAFMFPAEEIGKGFEDAQVQEQVPFFARFMLSNIRIFFLSFLVVSGTTFVSAIGLLKWKNLARILFIIIMVLGICWNLFALMMQKSMLTSVPELDQVTMDSGFHIMMTIMKIATFIFVTLFIYLFGWIIYKLTSPDIKSEFIESFPGKSDQINPRTMTRKKVLLSSAVILSIAAGILYFSDGIVPE